MITNDGLVIKSTDPEAIIDELHASSFSQCRSRRQFMDEVAGRTMLQFGTRVRTRTPAEFVADLVATGMLLEDDQAAA